jgi:hypothetical protein
MADDFFDLPEVSYLVDRVPVARLVLADCPMHRWFCAHARDANLSLQEQCRALGIPWHARKIGKEAVYAPSLEAAQVLAPTVFAATWPAENQGTWAERVCAAKLWPASVLHWVAYHAGEMAADEWAESRTWLSGQEAVAKTTLVRTVVERARGYNVEVERAERERREQQLRPLEIEYDYRNFRHVIRHGDGRVDYINDGAAFNPYLNALQAGTAQRAAAQQLAQEQYDIYLRQQMAAQQNYANAGLLGVAQGGLGHAHRILLPNDYVANGFDGSFHFTTARDRSPITYDAKLLEPKTDGRLTLRLLNTHEQFAEEGSTMHHCVETYFPRAKAGLSHIVSMSRGKKKVATAEFDSNWRLVQAKGPCNAKVSDNREIMAAFDRFAVPHRPPEVERPATTPDRHVVGMLVDEQPGILGTIGQLLGIA